MTAWEVLRIQCIYIKYIVVHNVHSKVIIQPTTNYALPLSGFQHIALTTINGEKSRT